MSRYNVLHATLSIMSGWIQLYNLLYVVCCLASPLDYNLFKDWLVLYYACSILLSWDSLNEV